MVFETVWQFEMDNGGKLHFMIRLEVSNFIYTNFLAHGISQRQNKHSL